MANYLQNTYKMKIQKPEILIVDDDLINRKILRMILRAEVEDMREAENGEEAIHILLSNEKIGIIILDLNMPIMDGYETIKAIEQNLNLKNRNIAIFISSASTLTTFKAKLEAEKIKSDKIKEFFSKPINIDEIKASIKSWTEKIYNSQLIN